MLKSSARSVIRLRGVRHNNLKNFDLDLPVHQLIVITGLSGSGKSSLAFDTLFAEGQRRYIETFSPYARQFFDRMDKPQVDSIEGIPPAIAIEQRNSVRTTRSTVGTMTEICDYMKMLWPHLAQLHCRQCGQAVRKDSPQAVWESIQCSVFSVQSPEVIVTFELPLSEKLSVKESLALVAKQGYQRLLLDGQILRLDEAPALVTHHSSPVASLTVIQDRLRLTAANRPRFVEACEQAYHFGKGKLAVHTLAPSPSNSQLSTLDSQLFSNRLHCARCDLEYREPSPALFSFNHPLGACPTCRGFGRVISIDYDLALPDRSKTLAGGVVKPWQTGQGADCQKDLLRACRHFGIPTDVPFDKLAKKWQEFVIQGEPDYGKDDEHEWPRAWYGIKGYFRWLESKAYKMHVRVLLSRYRAYTPCPDCHGQRFQPEALLYRVLNPSLNRDLNRNLNRSSPLSPSDGETAAVRGHDSLTLAGFYQLPIREALRFIETVAAQHRSQPSDPLGLVLTEVRSRLGYLNEVGLGYLTLDRPTRTLSGGETERVNLTTCLGTRLVNTLFVLDEPSVGLHPHDTARLVRILQTLRDIGNTVVVVEHEAGVIRAADQIVDLGPGQGEAGGQIVFQGPLRELLKSSRSLTGQYLGGRRQIEIPPRRPVKVGRPSRLSPPSQSAAASTVQAALNEAVLPYGDRRDACPTLKIIHAECHNLKNLTVEIPLQRFVCLTGVSGSGKTTLVREVLLPALEAELKKAEGRSKKAEVAGWKPEESAEAADSPLSPDLRPLTPRLTGHHHLARVVLVDQSPL